MKRFSIGDMLITLSWDQERFAPVSDPALDPFSIPDEPGRESDIAFSLTGTGGIDLSNYNRIFSALPDGLWKLWQKKNDDSYLISLHRAGKENEQYRFATVDPSFSRFEISHSGRRCRECDPLEYPLDELALSAHMDINGIGILLHSAMVSLRGEGYLFSGTSGSGKSTLSQLWLKERDAEVFTDDRVIIRETGGGIYAYGTPWHGTAGIHKNRSAPVGKIFFISHGSENRLEKISRVDAAKRLMVRCFPTFWHKEGMRFALDFCSKIASVVDCYDFGFVPDDTAIGFVKHAAESEKMTLKDKK